MNNAKASIHINKLAAAQRQLRAAIRMFFEREDELAIHTVASAAYRLVVDLKQQRGGQETEDYYRNVLRAMVLDYRNGTLADEILQNKDLLENIKKASDALPAGNRIDANEIAVSVPKALTTQYWRQRNRVANYLKHADNDAQAMILEDDVDNFTALMLALSAYADVGDIEQLGGEGKVLYIYSCIEFKLLEGMLPEHRKLAEQLMEMDNLSDRYAACRHCIDLYNEAN